MDVTLGLAHLSALHLDPPSLVTAASEAGFVSVGVRVFPATGTEVRYPIAAGAPMTAETVRRCSATGVSVLDVEAFTLDGARGPVDWKPALEAGAELGARILNVIGGDPDLSRLRDTLAELAADASGFGIRPCLEPISYQCVDTVAKAARLAEGTGAGIMLDVLHFVRVGGTVADLEALPAGVVEVIQLCDGPATVPDLPTPTELPLGQSVDGSPRQIESRAHRLTPGSGTFPLVEILRALPDVPISVEVPNVDRAAREGTAAYLKDLHRATTRLTSPDTAGVR
ncbi:MULTISPECIES: sugar phosphate isomerase/epimerase family protein [unclassified Streptomyces]|uniref:sugar phosphate isomerase/epimerase family protein n=1 Tax=unclassified Streptomyces TaxID=2593676 RepID=UPI002E308A12|nr:sugar phosphate isomerase/epimerase [Streptomyces sp. NBC_01361]